MKKLVLLGALIFAISGCSWFGGDSSDSSASGAADASTAKAAIEAAEAAVKKAGKAGGAWRDSESKFIKKAKEAAGKQDFETAIKLANKAKFEGEAAYAQGMSQKDAKPWLF